ncbi:unnamed protein product [Trichobilharzia regenti]|nr:unnamed protein product [Trichobilharzia regenti]
MPADWSIIKCVCLDVDSTVCVDEGLDELATYLGVSDQVKVITEKAMSGELDFTQAFEARLSMMNLTKKKLDEFMDNYPKHLIRYITDFEDKLKDSLLFLKSLQSHHQSMKVRGVLLLMLLLLLKHELGTLWLPRDAPHKSHILCED